MHKQSVHACVARISLLKFLTGKKFIRSIHDLRRIVTMKTIKMHLVIWISLTVLLGNLPSVFAEEEALTIMCDNGVVNIGDMDVDVQDKCGDPDSRGMNEWVYDFGPGQPVYTVIFKEGKVVRILEDVGGS